MKKSTQLTFAILTLTLSSFAQPQWKFHIAFEDATGAKDTIWCIWDTTATDGQLTSVDTALGEAGVAFDYSVFNVFIYSNVPFPYYDSTKTSAIPFYGSFSLEIRSFNYQYPITITWDSSLFHSPNLPLPVGYVNKAVMDNDYFFLVNNDPPLQKFNMLLDNTAFAPSFLWGSQSQFPVRIGIERDPSIGVIENAKSSNQLNVFPNPSNQIIKIKSDLTFESYSILSNDGKLVKIDNLKPTQSGNYSIPLTQIQSGFYNLILTNTKNQTYHEKIIIAR